MTTACRLCRLPEPLRSTMETALSHLHTLTARERQILAQLVASQESDELSRAMGISVRTVKFHVANLRQKLGGLSRFQLCLVGVFDLMDLADCPEHRSAHDARAGFVPAA
ncbi:helix-turn-helix domain-containing protein [Streptomyces vilmorinianum]|uniref:helix-turn-helix domain-containing protein n=1 Tax=Streptomyces vilmorinianum TaxID=3051092 RepID=UPI0010FB2670|nr:helix-turn-helix transcriptional regulator [Streptomyces vilmorinianum]